MKWGGSCCKWTPMTKGIWVHHEVEYMISAVAMLVYCDLFSLDHMKSEGHYLTFYGSSRNAPQGALLFAIGGRKLVLRLGKARRGTSNYNKVKSQPSCWEKYRCVWVHFKRKHCKPDRNFDSTGAQVDHASANSRKIVLCDTRKLHQIRMQGKKARSWANDPKVPLIRVYTGGICSVLLKCDP